MIEAAPEARAVAAAPPVPPAPPTPPRAVSSSDLAPLGRRPGSSPDLPPAGAVAPRARSSPDLQPQPTAAAPAAPANGAAPELPGLPLEVQEQLFGVLRAALDASLVPLLDKQQELEARLEALKAEARTGPSIPVLVGPSVAPAAPSVQPPAPTFAASPKTPSLAPKSASIVPTSYGFVLQPSAPPPRPSIEVALENIGPIDMPDFGRGRRAAGRVLVGLLLAGLVGAIAATVLSYT